MVLRMFLHIYLNYNAFKMQHNNEEINQVTSSAITGSHTQAFITFNEVIITSLLLK
jgi:hypothetical protein